MVRVIRPCARNSRYPYRAALITASACVLQAAASLGPAAASAATFWWRQWCPSIYSTVPISFARAALGGPIRIKTVDGEVEYEVKPGTQTDTKVRLKGKGVPSLRSRNVRGDHYVTLVVQVPERMNQAQKEALRRFDDAMNGITPPEEEKPKKKGIFK